MSAAVHGGSGTHSGHRSHGGPSRRVGPRAAAAVPEDVVFGIDIEDPHVIGAGASAAGWQQRPEDLSSSQEASSTEETCTDSRAGCCGGNGEVKYQYEAVLFDCEKKVLDKVEQAAASSHCFGAQSRSSEFHPWEGIDPNIPEHYQRWESIRERNVILSLLFWLLRHGRHEPTGCERINLLLLYMATWFWCFSFLERFKGREVACQQEWIETCVPVSLGGGCSDDARCAELAVIETTPDALKDYRAIARKRSSLKARERSLQCLGDDEARICNLSMCSGSNEPCDGGFCDCRVAGHQVIQGFRDLLLYMLFFKVVYFPFDMLLRYELTGCWHNLGVIASIAASALVALVGAQSFWAYDPRGRTFAIVLLRFLFTFLCLCLFEAIKAFALGYLVGTYVVQPNCWSIAARIWKYLLA
eukprot:CAMPEP_0176080234 /NCGR_PEP_ID=MMETSP0120_2-20121206/40132_1 /TAXON_ID=160619 /ORGANISM="Kryptoperidinium foliaceum, Strain CCMP 1326" /LENGTH=414 /DNA_ID=CAMNT_0017413997 /DNA_START=1 /DNA_END=1245 /DNA_ORIENTATION=+